MHLTNTLYSNIAVNILRLKLNTICKSTLPNMVRVTINITNKMTNLIVAKLGNKINK